MGVSKENIDAVLRLLQALDQRGDTIRQIAQNISSRTIWRSPDGSLSLPLTSSEQGALEGFVRAYVQECKEVLAAIDAAIGPAPV